MILAETGSHFRDQANAKSPDGPGEAYIEGNAEDVSGFHQSFRGAGEVREPGIHSPDAEVMDSGFAALRRPGMTKADHAPAGPQSAVRVAAEPARHRAEA